MCRAYQTGDNGNPRSDGRVGRLVGKTLRDNCLLWNLADILNP